MKLPKIEIPKISSKKKTKPTAKKSTGKSGSGRKRNLKNWQKTLAVVLIFIVGLSVLLYPTISNLWNQYIANLSIGKYNDVVADTSKEDKEALIRSAVEYNNKLVTEVVPDAFAVRNGIKDEAYERELAVDDTGIMGTVEIPVISVSLPIFHYTTDDVLGKGAGHLLGSSLPVGGDNTHTVITAHRGLPSMRLFTDLDLMKKGDEFYIHILDEHLAYEVDQIITVKPEETNELAIKSGKDYATLITCTPYGVNSHRLFVRGHRIPYVPKEVESRASFWRDVPWWARIVASIFALANIYILLWTKLGRKRKKKDEKGTKSDKPTTGNVADEKWNELFGEQEPTSAIEGGDGDAQERGFNRDEETGES